MKKAMCIIIGILCVWLLTLLPGNPFDKTMENGSLQIIPIILLGFSVIYFIFLIVMSDEDKLID